MSKTKYETQSRKDTKRKMKYIVTIMFLKNNFFNNFKKNEILFISHSLLLWF